MPWKRLLEQRRVVAEQTTQAELEAQVGLAARALADARVEAVSDDGRFDRAYDAARALATVVIRTAGYRVKGVGGGHYNTFLALEAADPLRFTAIAAYFNLCRDKRNQLSYVNPGVVSRTELEEILREVPRFRAEVAAWLREHRPELARLVDDA